MLRVDFDVDDVARIRFSASPAPLAETAIAIDELRRARSRGELRRNHHPESPAGSGRAPASTHRSDQPAAWRAQWLGRMAASFPRTARPLLELIPPSPPTPEFIDPLAADLEEGLELIRAAPQHLVRADLARCWQVHASPGTSPPLWIRNLAAGDRQARELVIRAHRDLYRACVEPFWEDVTQRFRADLAARIPLLAAGGYGQLLTSIHPQLTWRDHGLERETGSGRHPLGGTGLQLFPSAFWSGPPAFAIRPQELGGNVLFYAASHNTEVTGPGDARPRRDDSRERPLSAGDGQPGGHRSLAVLLGHTRAEVLGALQQPCGTTELATRLYISAPSASEHVAALRGAGLAHTARHGQTVCHSLTPLGQNLLSAAGHRTPMHR